MSRRPALSRRAFLGTTAALGTAAVGGTALSSCAHARQAAGADRPAAGGSPGQPAFRGPHQSGILTAPARAGMLVAFDCVDPDRARLAGTFRALTEQIAELMSDRPPAVADTDPELPPRDNGVLAGAAGSWVSATVSVGASLFDTRYGLAPARPRELVPMTRLANDRLDPARTHGDVLLVLQADHPDGCVHALRRIMRRTRSGLVLRWLQDGFNRPDRRPAAGQTETRNLLGFKDGTGNPDATAAAVMDELVWTGPGDGEPAWAVGGSYQAVRLIRMFVEQWDRAALSEQERIIGRRKATGAPLDGRLETDEPRYADDPHGSATPLDAHIRLANPRGPRTANRQILRRGFSYSRGFDRAGLLDQGLAFVSYQRRLGHFLQAQARLAGEPLEEYVESQGGGFFYALPGVDTAGGWLGRSLLEG